MGGGDWSNRQMIQQTQLDRAYQRIESPGIPVKTAHVEIPVSPEPDLFDKAYVMLRTIVPSWLMAVFIVVGMSTVGVVTFKKQLRNLIIIWGDLLKAK